MEDKGFEIKCLNCNSTDCSIEKDSDYGSDDEWVIWSYKIVCNNCGQYN